MNIRLSTLAAGAALIAGLLAGCSTSPATRDSSRSSSLAIPGAGGLRPTAVVPETFVSADADGEELDSLATWPAEDGSTWLIATAKASHRLFVFDADSGTQLRTVGSKGEALGQFRRPNGVIVQGDHLFVVERDNHRVQVLTLPDFTPLAVFGDAVLRSPYGIWMHEAVPGEYDAYVTDSFMYGEKYDQVPAWDELSERVRRFAIRFDPATGALDARFAGSFGDTSPESALRMVESIAGDPANDRLLIADEDRRHVSTLRDYTLDGRFTGRSLPDASFGAEAEGVALWSCRGGDGYWVAVDQLAPLTVFHLFDRRTLEHRGSFKGETTSYTDGIALHPAATRAFTGGALFAVHDDRAVTAFDLREVARVLHLSRNCTE
ncbi:phytase [Marilutibacter chinensis]|uniref:Phytase n=1 Tax=Marilutibacter chinensis TaxID=2912247 RepID=A0ABS9HUG1_9GAMM|nr:phytase [Lysobacter chinensis]MCF7222524.1 phytase [Lysobacter chinensis]